MVYEFGLFRLDSSERLLLREGKPIPLTSKVFDLLSLLVRKRGHLVEKSEIMREVWSDSIVEDNNLTVSMSTLRKALGENQNNYRYIETVPKRGYRFVAEVQMLAGDKSRDAADYAPNVKSASVIKTLAVLPFDVLSQEESEDYLGFGLADALITALSHMRQIIILPSRTVSKYTRPGDGPLIAGHKLGVDIALDGQIQKTDELVRVTVQLTDIKNGCLLWAESFTEKFTNIRAVQDSIAQQVVRALMLKITYQEQKLLTKRYTDNLEAFESYMYGRYLWNKRSDEGLRKAIDQFNRAIELDPNYALAHIGMADTYALLSDYSMLPPKQAMPIAMAAAKRALEIDETLTKANTTLAYVSTFYGWDWSNADTHFNRAIKLNSNYATAHHWYALYLTVVGRWEDALKQLRLALELDPLSLMINANLGIIFLYSGRYTEAIKQCRMTLNLDPDFGAAHLYLGLAYERIGKYAEAIEEVEQAITISGGSSREIGVLGYILAVAGQTSKALKLLEELEKSSSRRYVSPFDVALIYVGLRETDRAFEWLERAYEERSDWLVWVKVAGELDSIRSDPRLDELIRRIGLESSQSKTINSLAVLPLHITGDDEKLEYLSEGITVNIINNLSQLSSLKVIAPSTVFRYKGKDVDLRELGARLNVGAVLTGKILQWDESLVIKIELASVVDGSHIWGEQYRRPFSDLLQVQEEIAHEVSEKLQLKLTGEEKRLISKRYTENVEAYRLYLKGRYFWTKYTVQSMKRGLEFFQQAIKLDPKYALAYTGVADSYQRLSNFIIPTKEAIPKAMAAATRALELDDTLVEAHLSLGMINMWFHRDWSGAETELKKALSLNPGYSLTHQRYATFLTYMGRLEEALTENNIALELDPLSLTVNTNLGTNLSLLLRFDEAINQLQSTLEMDPNFYLAHVSLGMSYVYMGEYSKGIEELHKAREIDNTQVLLGLLGYAYGMAGNRAEALRVLEELKKEEAKQNYVSPYSFVLIFLGLKKKNEAFKYLEKAYEEQNDLLAWLKVGPELDILRSDSRFIDLLLRVGFKP